MQTAEEILENIMCCTIEEDADLDVKSNYYYQHDDVVKAIEQAQKEAYNQALDDTVENIKLNSFDINPCDDTCDGYRLTETSKPPLYTRGYNGLIIGKVEIDKDSILKLKK